MNLLTQYPNERWQPIVGHPGHHISDYGRVYSDRLNRLKPVYPNPDGYLQVSLYTNRKSTTLLVHRLVAEYFVPNHYHDPEVNHQDGNKKNAHFGNLEWCTHPQNMNHAFVTGLIPRKKPVTQEIIEESDAWIAR